ncbi:hypothetical protein PMZ80_011167 [Knufia obscura]|uniref:Uncharacterized protein n=2 Tax=Knufia TaxID=430999 RepID=A0AAN8EC01_9EURO|nr:hypothetical protein PMZ80_011167 [Knufia obscura]KAK5947693.1 hypothetical protein OHC33_011291 [Knufia fluminis]
MDERAHRNLMLSHTLREKNRKWKRRSDNAEAKLGWTNAQHAKKLRRLEDELDQYRRDKARLEAELRGWRTKFANLDAEHATNGDAKNVHGQLQGYEDEIKRFKEHMMHTRNAVLQMYQQQAPSLMAAALHSDGTTDGLLVLLQGRWKTSQATIRKHRKKVQSMQDALESERQRNNELLQGLNDKDMADPRLPKAAGDQLTRLFDICSKLSTVQQWLDDRVDNESKSYGHSDAGAVGLTACNVLLCEACHHDMLSCRMLVNWHVRQCPYCPRQCVLLPLPKQVTKPTKQETIEMQDTMELIQQDLSELTGGSSAAG